MNKSYCSLVEEKHSITCRQIFAKGWAIFKLSYPEFGKESRERLTGFHAKPMDARKEYTEAKANE